MFQGRCKAAHPNSVAGVAAWAQTAAHSAISFRGPHQLKSYVKTESRVKGTVSVVTPSAPRTATAFATASDAGLVCICDPVPPLMYDPKGHDTITAIYDE
jgi:hypothetical protein